MILLFLKSPEASKKDKEIKQYLKVPNEMSVLLDIFIYILYNMCSRNKEKSFEDSCSLPISHMVPCQKKFVHNLPFKENLKII